ncbi:MAG: type VI secretion protein IcmF/TssM N-terminal domain-containing protein, partial [bacterium]|nr:type VI secretion protein IcmF/TssM N-terminal domain-containing protein [bacterium]
RWQAREQGKADEEEWLQFLQMLQKQRPKRPINGVLALCSIERVLGDPAEAKEWAQKMRRQINEIMENLQTHVPVYLIFNKCDLIHGFVEYFQDLNQEERKQIWGFTRPYKPQKKKSGDGLESDRDTILADYDREFSNFVETLETRRLHRLVDPQLFSSERAALCIFPSEFRELREPMREFISNVFYENPYGHNPVLRGIYFTSATQMEGNPIVQLMKQVGGEYDIPVDALPFKSKQTVDTYFLHDLVQDIIFKDSNLGGRFKSSLFDRTRIILAAALGVATILMGIWMGTSYAVNSSKNAHLYTVADSVSTLTMGSDAVASLDRLDALRIGLEDYQSSSIFGVFYWAFGRHKESDLAKAGNWRLGSSAEDLFIVRAWEDAESILRSRSEARQNLERFIASYRTYIFLSNAEGHELVDPSVIATHVMNNQFNNLSRREDKHLYEEKFNALLEYYHKFDSTQTKVFEPDPRRIENAKRSISDAWEWEQLTADIIDRISTDEQDFSAEEFSDAFKSSYSVPYEYTYTGFDQLIGAELDLEFERIRKDELLKQILGDQIASRSTNPLIEEYEKTCIEQWTEFFASISVQSGKNNLEDISDRKSPLEALLLSAADYTQFRSAKLRDAFTSLHHFTDRIPPGGLLDSALTGGTKDVPAKEGLKDYMAAVTAAADAAIDVGANSDKCASAYNGAAAKISDQEKFDFEFTRSDFSRALTDFLREPFKMAKSLARGRVQACLNAKWNDEVYDRFQEDYAKSYPFSKSGQDKSYSALEEFFNYEGYFKTFVKEQATPARRVGSFGNRYNTAVENAKTIWDNLSGNTSLDIRFYPGMEQDNKLEEIKIFRDDSLVFTYENGPEDILQLDLPWDADRLEVHLRTTDGRMGITTFEGEWAPFRLLDMASVANNKGKLKIRDAEATLAIDVQSSGGGAKLYKVLRDFKLPSTVER